MLEVTLNRAQELLEKVRGRTWNHAQIEVATMEICRRLETLVKQKEQANAKEEQEE